MTEEEREKRYKEEERKRFRLYYWEYGGLKKLEGRTKLGASKQLVFPDLQSAEYEAQRQADKLGYEVVVAEYPPYDYINNISRRDRIVSVFWSENEEDE